MKLGLTWRQKLGPEECPYMERWAISFGRKGPSLRLHHWFRSDDKRFKHDHPADFTTLVLAGAYDDLGSIPGPCEACGGVAFGERDFRDDVAGPCPACGGSGTVWVDTVEAMTPGKIRRRSAEHRHTVDVRPGGCWTLCWFHRDRRRWGFWVPRKVDGKLKFKKSNKFFLEHGHHPCDQP